MTSAVSRPATAAAAPAKSGVMTRVQPEKIRSVTTASVKLAAIFESAVLQHYAASDAHTDGIGPAMRKIEQV